jgi:hypothetical protein
VQQQNRWVAGPPLRGLVLVEQDGIAVRNFDAMSIRLKPRHVVNAKRYDGLQVTPSDHTMRLKPRWLKP